MIVPPPLRPGDPIAVVAPSSPFDRTLVLRGLGWLGERYRILYEPSLFERQGYLAGSDDRRLAELDSALTGEARAVIAVRGGYGLSRIAHRVDWEAALRVPRWIVGCSDVTTLHAEAWRRGLASIHGPMVSALGRGDQRARARWIASLEDPLAPRQWSGLSPLRAGRAAGRLVGGNLASLHACAAAGRLVIPEGAVVLIEDVNERPYRVDRMLTNLVVGGHLGRACGILVGELTDCTDADDQVTVQEVLRERLTTLAVPVLAGFPAGHGKRNDPVVLGSHAELDAHAGTCSLSAPS